MAKTEQYVLKKSLHFTKHKFYGRVGDTFLYTVPPESRMVVSRNGDLVANFPLPEASLLGLLKAGYFESVLQDVKEDIVAAGQGIMSAVESAAEAVLDAVKGGEGFAAIKDAVIEGAEGVGGAVTEAATEIVADVKNEVVVVEDALGLAEKAKAEIQATEGIVPAGDEDDEPEAEAELNEDTGEVMGESAEVQGTKKKAKAKKAATSN